MDGLEPALQRRVLLDVLLVLVERGCPDALQLAAGQGGLQHVGRVDCPLRAARADDGVQLVDEKHDVARGEDLLHDALETLLELAAVLRAGHQRGEVQGQHALAHEDLGDRPVHDLLRQPFHDGRLADTRLADQHRVVLRPPRQDLDDPLDLLLPPDDRVQLVVTRKGGEVAAELVQRRRGLLRGCLRLLLGLRGGALVVTGPADLQDGLPQPVGGDVVPRQVAGHDAALLLHRGQQEVLGADVLVAHVAGLFRGVFQDLLPPLGRRDIAEDQAALSLGQALLDLRLHLRDVHLDPQQRLDRHAFPVLQEGEDDVLGQELVGVEPLGFLLCEYGEHLLCPLRETLEHGVSLPSVA